MTKRKPTYEQALNLEKGQAARRAQQKRERAERDSVPPLTPEQTAEWEAQKKEALVCYREARAAGRSLFRPREES